MRHSIWFIQSGIGRPMSTGGLPPHTPSPDTPSPDSPPRPVRASTRLRVRSLLAFVAMLLLLASTIELVAALTTDGGASVPLGTVGVCIAIAIVCTLAVTRERRG